MSKYSTLLITVNLFGSPVLFNKKSDDTFNTYCVNSAAYNTNYDIYVHNIAFTFTGKNINNFSGYRLFHTITSSKGLNCGNGDSNPSFTKIIGII